MNRNVRLARPGRGQLRTRLGEMLRVDHAGEMAAVQIYRGQKDVFRAAGRAALADDMERMEGEEQVHLDRFNALLTETSTRPTLMTPLWRIAAYGLGVGTALLGEKAAHACTEAVETVISDHYADQADEWEMRDPALAEQFREYREDELRHHDHAVEQGAHEAPGYELLTGLIKAGCRVAIKVSEKV
nr:demethoxyubiquinone hydroxylase family protein [Brevundimonas aveniformis]